MDKLENRQEERNPGREKSSEDEKTGGDGEIVGGSTETSHSQSSVKNKWNHDQELNFSGIKQQLSVLASALQKAIEVEKKRLSQTIEVRNSYKK